MGPMILTLSFVYILFLYHTRRMLLKNRSKRRSESGINVNVMFSLIIVYVCFTQVIVNYCLCLFYSGYCIWLRDLVILVSIIVNLQMVAVK